MEGYGRPAQPSRTIGQCPQRRPGLARGGMQSLQDPREPAARRHPPATRHANLEVGSFAEVQILSKGSLSAAGPDNQADPDARDHALQVGASGRGALGTDWPRTD
jgi:hypothetical protein